MSQQKSIRRPVAPFDSVEEARQIRTRLVDFCPPKDNPIAKAIASIVVPWRLRNRFGVVGVEISEESLKRLKERSSASEILAVNHPSDRDPEIIFSIGTRVKQDYNYLAAREVFDEEKGKRGRMMQSLGCYSVVRGKPDRESFDTTKRLLVENKRKLVIYVEGEIGRQNGVLMPVEPGSIQLAYWAIQEKEKQRKKLAIEKNVEETTLELSSVKIRPIGITYRLVGDNSDKLEASLSAIEQELNVAPQGGMYERLRTVALTTLTELQTHYKLVPAEGAPVTTQVRELQNHILARVGKVLEVEVPEVSTLDRLRFVRNKLDEHIYKSEEGMSNYKKRLDRGHAEELVCLYQHLRRVQVFIAIYDGYVKETMTQDRFAEVLDKLEIEIFGARTLKGKCVAFVHVGEAIDLLTSYDQYKKDKRVTVARLADELYAGLSSAIKLADQESARIKHLTVQ